MPATRELTRDAVRELDRRAIEDYGIPSIVLMENAGRACADEAARHVGEASRGPVLVLCGPGNNGGDGLVIARTLHNRGFETRVAFVGEAAKLESASGDVATNVRLWRRLGGELEVWEGAGAVAALEAASAGAPLCVDALFGTGLTRPLRGVYAEVVGALNASGRPVLAVDLPSGLDADTGAELGAAVHARLTVTFVARKPGFRLGSGPSACGRVDVAEIGIPRAFLEEAG